MEPFVKVAAVSALLVISALAFATPPILPPVQVVGTPCSVSGSCITPSPFFWMNYNWAANRVDLAVAPSITGGFSGKSCKQLLATLKSALRDKAEENGCDVGNPAPVPGIPSPTRGTWHANGCGIGTWADNVLARMPGAVVDDYTGNIDKPLSGVSFLPACNAHDKCYYGTSDKGHCDDAFANSVDRICEGKGAACVILAGLYTTAIAKGGKRAFNTDQHKAMCARISSFLRNGKCA